MAVKVYSAAIGTKTMKDSSIETAWDGCTEMFRDDHASSYMRGHWPIDYLNLPGNRPRGNVGSIYRCISGMGATRVIKITSWSPPRSFAYVSVYPSDPRRERGIDELREEMDRCPSQRKMVFSLESKDSDTIITIKRWERGDISWWASLTDKYGDRAAMNLSLILTGRNELSPTVERADHLRDHL